MGDSNLYRQVDSLFQTHPMSDVDKRWKKSSLVDIQPRSDWFIDPSILMDDPLETITIDHAMKKFNETKKDQMAWQDTNCIEGLKVPSPNPFVDNKYGLK